MRISKGATACGAAMLLFLAGCEGIDGLGKGPAPDPATTSEKDTPSASSDSEVAARPPPSKPEAPKKGSAGSGRGLAAKIVVGGSEADVTRVLGEPTAVRNEPPAMVWQYAVPKCKLDVFFYFDIRNKDFRALSYKFYPDQNTVEAEQACLASIQNAKSSMQKPN